MGLRSQIQTKMGKAFDTTLADAVLVLTLVDVSQGTYDTSTGVVTPVEVSYPTRGVVESYTAREIAASGGAVTNKDLKVTILANEISVTIRTGMRFEMLGDTDKYSVENADLDPAKAAYTLQVRS